MSITKKAGDLAQEGFAAEDIAALLDTTPSVIRTLLHRTKSGGKSMTAKSLAQIMLVKILQNSEENRERHT